MIHVFLISPIRLFREGLLQLLWAAAAIRVAGHAASCQEAAGRLGDSGADVVLVDLPVTESLAAVRKLHDVVPGASFIALAVSETEDHIVAWAKAGVSGYVACDASAGELVTTITAVARGEAPCSPRMAAWLLKEVAALASAPDVEEADNRLTRREREIVELVERGLSNKEIARDLHIALSTVKNHVHNILDKLQVSRRSHVPRARSGHRFTTARNDSENVGMDPGN